MRLQYNIEFITRCTTCDVAKKLNFIRPSWYHVECDTGFKSPFNLIEHVENNLDSKGIIREFIVEYGRYFYSCCTVNSDYTRNVSVAIPINESTETQKFLINKAIAKYNDKYINPERVVKEIAFVIDQPNLWDEDLASLEYYTDLYTDLWACNTPDLTEAAIKFYSRTTSHNHKIPLLKMYQNYGEYPKDVNASDDSFFQVTDNFYQQIVDNFLL